MVLVALYLKSVGGYRKTSEADCELLSAQLITVSRTFGKNVTRQAYTSPEGRQIPVGPLASGNKQ
jgi:hypothetical protein